MEFPWKRDDERMNDCKADKSDSDSGWKESLNSMRRKRKQIETENTNFFNKNEISTFISH
jgi:hypothetical protein